MSTKKEVALEGRQRWKKDDWLIGVKEGGRGGGGKGRTGRTEGSKEEGGEQFERHTS